MKIFLYLFFLFFASISVFAQTFELVIENNSSVTLGEIYIAQPNEEFEVNYLDYDLEPGMIATIIYESNNDGNCVFDILAYGLDETSYLKVDLDFCYNLFINIYDEDLELDESSGNTGSSNASNSGSNVGGVVGKLTANKWKMIYNGEDYGSIICKPNGVAIKTGAGETMRTEGTWNYDDNGSKFTMHFESEGPAVTGILKDLGSSFELSLYNGAIVWKLEKM